MLILLFGVSRKMSFQLDVMFIQAFFLMYLVRFRFPHFYCSLFFSYTVIVKTLEHFEF